MTDEVKIAPDNNADDPADSQIIADLDLDHPVSFFLSADAGSGKTRSLVIALNRLREKSGRRLRLHGQRVGVITYTNAACDVIRGRIEYDPLFSVSTIHSFVWSLISELQTDIRSWLRTNLAAEIDELRGLQQKGRPGTKAAFEREEGIKIRVNRLAALDAIRRFTYNPNGDNLGRDSLSHAEVIKIGADLLTEKPLMRQILISRFPILLIDESHDTSRTLMEALLKVQAEHKDRFCLGLFGDLMQRIYADGKPDLGLDLASDWDRPSKKLNHRSPRRIIRLINRIRSSVDAHEQQARSDSELGLVRLFILPTETGDKTAAEQKAAERMAVVTGDASWSGPHADVKSLVLEHHMAARRMGFQRMFDALDQNTNLRTGLRDGSLPGVRLFSERVLPVLEARANGDEFMVAGILRRYSPLLTKDALLVAGSDQRAMLKKAQSALLDLQALWSRDNDPRLIDVLDCVHRTQLFDIPENLRPIARREAWERGQPEGGRAVPIADEPQSDPDLSAWDEFLLAPFSEIKPYSQYVVGKARFDTHQGVKGLEFPRVMVIIDDAEARGFMFNYEKLFGAKAKTKADFDSEREGRDSSIDRTRRLLYVTCSRAKKSLAIIAYTSQPGKVKEWVIDQGWFDPDEVELM